MSDENLIIDLNEHDEKLLEQYVEFIQTKHKEAGLSDFASNWLIQLEMGIRSLINDGLGVAYYLNEIDAEQVTDEDKKVCEKAVEKIHGLVNDIQGITEDERAIFEKKLESKYVS